MQADSVPAECYLATYLQSDRWQEVELRLAGDHPSARANEAPAIAAANRSATLPDDKHWLIGFRLVLAPLPPTTPQQAAPLMMNEPSVDPTPITWNKPTDQQVFHEPIPFVQPDKDHPLLSQLHHHHCPTITWCANGDLLAAQRVGFRTAFVLRAREYGPNQATNLEADPSVDVVARDFNDLADQLLAT